MSIYPTIRMHKCSKQVEEIVQSGKETGKMVLRTRTTKTKLTMGCADVGCFSETEGRAKGRKVITKQFNMKWCSFNPKRKKEERRRKEKERQEDGTRPKSEAGRRETQHKFKKRKGNQTTRISLMQHHRQISVPFLLPLTPPSTHSPSPPPPVSPSLPSTLSKPRSLPPPLPPSLPLKDNDT